MKEYNIFLSSSTEGLEEERKVFSTIIEKRVHIPNVKLIAKLWEEEIGRSSNPGEKIQDSINPLLPECDIIVFIFYNKLGAGVKKEYDEAIRLKKRIIFFQKKFNKSIGDMSQEEAMNFFSLQTFISRLQKENAEDIFINQYEHIDSLENILRKALEEHYGHSAPVNLKFTDKIQINSVIPHNNNFVGRVEELKSLDELFTNYNNIAIFGMGGMGKTSLASKYCEKYSSYYEKIIWLPFHINLEESIMSLEADYNYQNEGCHLGFGDIVSYLNSIEGKKLLVIDNFDISKDEINVRVDEILRCFPTYKILFTTRTNLEAREEDIYVYNLVELKTEESIQLFKKYYKNELNDYQVNLAQLKIFLDAIYGHTLITELVAKTLRNHFSINMSEIIGYIKNENEFGETESVSVKWHDTQLAITDISTALYNKNILSNDECRMLEILAILCEESIDVRYLMSVISPDNRKNFEDLINRLATNGWINKSGFMITCHRVLADIVLKDAFLNSNQINIILENLNSKTNYNALDDIAVKRPYYQMQRLLLTFICNNRINIDGISYESIATNVINYYYNGDASVVGIRKEKGETNSDIEKSPKFVFLKYIEKHLEKDSITFCHIYECLSNIYKEAYKYDEAESLLLKSIEIEESLNIGDNLDVARTSFNLSNLYMLLGKRTLAIPLLEKSYRIYSNILGENCIENLNNCLAFASLCEDLDSLDDVKEWASRAAKIIDNSDVAELNPIRINYYRNMSAVSNSEKIDYLEKAEDLATRIYGADHPILAEIYSEKAVSLKNLGKYSESLECFDKWHKIDLQNFGYTITGAYIYDWFKNIITFEELINVGTEESASSYLSSYNESICAKNEDNKNIPTTFRRYSIQFCGYAYYFLNQYKEALDSFNKVLYILNSEIDSIDTSDKQLTYSCFNNIVNKSEKFKSKLFGDDDKIQILDWIVRCYLSLQQKTEAYDIVRSYEDYLNDFPLDKSLINGRIYLYQKEYERAKELFSYVYSETEEELKKDVCEKIARILHECAVDLIGKEEYEALESLLKDSVNYYLLGNYDEKFEIEIYKTLSLTSYLLNKLDSGKEYFYKTINIVKRTSEDINYQVAKTYLEFANILLTKGVKYVSIEFYEKASYYINLAEISDECYSDINRGLAIAQRETGETELSIETMLHCIEHQKSLNTTSQQTLSKDYLCLAQTYLLAENYEKAKEYSEIAMRLAADDTIHVINILGALAKSNAALDNDSEALSNYQKRISLLKEVSSENVISDIADTYDDLASLLFKLGRNEESIECYQKGISFIVDDEDSRSLLSGMYYRLSMVQRDTEDYTSAIENMQKCIAIQNTLENITDDILSDDYQVLGMCYAKSEQYADAESALVKAIELNPEDNIVRMNRLLNQMAYTSKMLEKYDESVEYYKKQIVLLESITDQDVRSVVADTCDDLAGLLYQLDRNEESIGCYQKGISFIVDDEDSRSLLSGMYYRLSMVQRDIEDYTSAIENMQKCIAIQEATKNMPQENIFNSNINLVISHILSFNYETAVKVLNNLKAKTPQDEIEQHYEIDSLLAYSYSFYHPEQCSLILQCLIEYIRSSKKVSIFELSDEYIGVLKDLLANDIYIIKQFNNWRFGMSSLALRLAINQKGIDKKMISFCSYSSDNKREKLGEYKTYSFPNVILGINVGIMTIDDECIEQLIEM